MHPMHPMHRARPDRITRLIGLSILLPMLLIAQLLSSPSLCAQEPVQDSKPESHPEQVHAVTDLYQVRYADVERLAELIRIFDVTVRADRHVGALTLRGSKASVETALTALRRLDVPPKPTPSVELTLWILLGSKTPDGEDLPETLRPVARQLEGTLGYAAFDLLDTVLVRTRDGGKVATGGTFQASGKLSVPANYGLDVVRAEVIPGEGDAAPSVRLNQLQFSLYPVLKEDQTGRPTTLQTDVEVHEGQKVVVGKATTSPDNQGLILVVEARVE
jgi:hypothetical protein